MQVKRVDVNIWRAIWLKIVSLELLREKKNKLLKSVLPNHMIVFVTTNWWKTFVKEKYKVAKLITKKKILSNF